jgi:putative two-component system response regulator
MCAEAPAILVVDDVELNRAVLYEIFRERFDVIEAGSGPEALEIISRQQARIVLVLLDMILPEMDGFQVLHEISERALLPDIPVVMITSGLSAEKAAAVMRLGVKDFIERPFNVEIIKTRVLRSLSAFVKEQMEEQDALPDWLDGLVHVFEKTTVSVRKAR